MPASRQGVRISKSAVVLTGCIYNVYTHNMTTLNVRIDEKIKEKAGKTFAKLGLDMSGAIKLFLNQAIKEDGLPFIPTNNDAVIRARWDREVAEALKSGKSYRTAKALLDDIK